jgi:predicted nucleotidyltransferase
MLPVRGACLLVAYLHGSAVLVGWRAAVSDVDVLVVLDEGVDLAGAQVLADVAARRCC